MLLNPGSLAEGATVYRVDGINARAWHDIAEEDAHAYARQAEACIATFAEVKRFQRMFVTSLLRTAAMWRRRLVTRMAALTAHARAGCDAVDADADIQTFIRLNRTGETPPWEREEREAREARAREKARRRGERRSGYSRGGSTQWSRGDSFAQGDFGNDEL